ncbi:MAG: peptidylprolyl isomerase [Rugosibacter sp.]|jgi:peptidyl-prolyl cis-trans isomerase C
MKPRQTQVKQTNYKNHRIFSYFHFIFQLNSGITMNHSLRCALMITLAASVLGSTPVFAAETAIVTVNGKAVPKSRADMLVSAQVAQGQPDSPELREAVKEELIRREVLAQAAAQKGLDKSTEVQAQMDMARQGVLIGAYLKDYVKRNPISDAQLKKEYDDLKAKVGNKEYKVRHILVDKEEDAKAIIEKLKKGEKFDDLAKQSKDPGSKERGGDLGWASPAAFVKPFSDAMTKLEKGKYTSVPVKSDFGWHVIQLDDTRDTKIPPFEEAKGQIAQQMQQGLVQKHMDSLRAKAKIQ